MTNFATMDRAKRLARNDNAMLRELVQTRRRCGLTQTDVAEALGISQQAVSQFERLESDPRLSTIRQYANVVGVLVDHGVTFRWDESQWQPLNCVVISEALPRESSPLWSEESPGQKRSVSAR